MDVHEIIDDRFRDLKAEVVALAYMLKRNPNVSVERVFFSSVPHTFLFDVAAAHRAPVPKAVMFDEIEQRVAAVKVDAYKKAASRIYAFKTTKLSVKSIRSVVQRLKRMADSREILVRLDSATSQVLAGKLPAAKRLVREASLVGSEPSSKHAGEYLADFDERLALVKARKNQPHSIGVPTGIRKLDVATGGVLPGEFGIVLGQTSIGKSMFLENIAINAWQKDFNSSGKGYNVLYVSVEMTKHDLEFRADARLARVAHRKFRLGSDWTKADVRRWKAVIEDLRNTTKTFLHFECVPRFCTVNDIEAIAERVQDKYKRKLDLLVVDYLNILGTEAAGSAGEGKKWFFQADIAWQLKALAADFNDGEGLAIWTANQVTDAAEGKSTLTFTDTKYGRASAEVAPIVVGLVRTQDDILHNRMQLQVVKFRSAKRVAPVFLRPNFDFCMVDDEQRAFKSLENI